MIKDSAKESKSGKELFPQLSLDCVIFGFHDNLLKILLLRWKGTSEWSLPGGMLFQDESLHEAANRILEERTGLQKLFLKQFHTFGSINRYDKIEIQDKLSHLIPKELWYSRAISVGYYALVDYEQVFPNPDQYSDACSWFTIDAIPKLLFDHNEISQKALFALRREIGFQPVGLNLLPQKFTMPEMMRMYEAILGKKVDPRNFQKKILRSGIVKKLKEVRRGVAHKSPFLYQFDLVKYEEVLHDGGLLFI